MTARMAEVVVPVSAMHCCTCQREIRAKRHTRQIVGIRPAFKAMHVARGPLAHHSMLADRRREIRRAHAFDCKGCAGSTLRCIHQRVVFIRVQHLIFQANHDAFIRNLRRQRRHLTRPDTPQCLSANELAPGRILVVLQLIPVIPLPVTHHTRHQVNAGVIQPIPDRRFVVRLSAHRGVRHADPRPKARIRDMVHDAIQKILHRLHPR